MSQTIYLDTSVDSSEEQAAHDAKVQEAAGRMSTYNHQGTVSTTITENGAEIYEELKAKGSYNVAEEVLNEADNILDTARQPNGSPTTELTDKTRVMYGGMEVDIGTLVRQGVLYKLGEGNYVDPAAEGFNTEADFNEAPQEDFTEAEPLPRNHEIQIDRHLDRIPDHVQQLAIDQVIAHMGTEGVDFRRLGEAAEMNDDMVRDNVEGIFNLLGTQAGDAISKMGVNPEALYEWARESHPEMFREAMYKQVYARHCNGYRELTDMYLRSVAPSADVVSQQYEVTTSPDGRTKLVNIPGLGLTDIRTAAKLGYI